MSVALLFCLAPLLMIPLGAGAAFHSSVRGFPLLARLAVAYLAGALILAAEGTLLSMLRIPWTLATLALPALCVSLVLSLWWRRRGTVRLPAFLPSKGILFAASAAAGLALIHLGLLLVTSRATSVDYTFFWGVKGVRFAQARGIDAHLLAWPFFSHGVPDYPPLVHIAYAWCILVAGKMSWRGGILTTGIWLVATIPIVLAYLRKRIADDQAILVTALWTVALSISLGFSFSGGNAEAPLLMFETAAGVALLVEDPSGSSRFLPAIALAGAALTKVEGLVGAGGLVLGTLLRDLLDRREGALRRVVPMVLAPVLGVGLWFAFQLVSGLPVGYRAHGTAFGITSRHLGTVLVELVRNLAAGTLGLSWIVPLLLLAGSGRRLRRVLPGVCLVVALLTFLVFEYMHDKDDPSLRIAWTAPRVSQPALSLLILSAGVAWFSPRNSASVESPPKKG